MVFTNFTLHMAPSVAHIWVPYPSDKCFGPPVIISCYRHCRISNIDLDSWIHFNQYKEERTHGDSREVVRNCTKNFDVFEPPNFGGGAPKLLSEFYKSVSPSNMWQTLVTIGQATSKIRRRKKKDLNYSGRTMASGHCWAAAIVDEFYFSKASYLLLGPVVRRSLREQSKPIWRTRESRTRPLDDWNAGM